MTTPAASTTAVPTRVAFVLIPRFNMMTLTTAIEPMRIANYLAPGTLFEWRYLSGDADEVVASNGMSVRAAPLDVGDEHCDVVVLCGSWGCEHYENPALFAWLRRLDRAGATLVSLEVGVYLLARAGLLSHRAATTHWSVLAGFAEQYPKVDAREQLFTVDGNIITCAGGTAGLDVMLHLIASRHGEQLAAEVADQVLHHPVRDGDSPQRHTMGAATDALHPDVRAAIALIEQHIEEPWPVPRIAARLKLSQRHLERLFRRHMGCSVVQFGQLLRLQYARALLTSTRMSIREVSVACGFNSLSYFSQAFTKCFARRPSEYRQAWPDNEAMPSWPGTVFSFVQRARIAGARKRPPRDEPPLSDSLEWP